MIEYQVNDIAEFTLMKYFNDKRWRQLEKMAEEIQRHAMTVQITEPPRQVPEVRIVRMGDLRL